MVERAAGYRPEKPTAQPTPIKQESPHAEPMPKVLDTIQHISDFVTGRGKEQLEPGKKPPEYSQSPTEDSKKVDQLASKLIAPKPKR